MTTSEIALAGRGAGRRAYLSAETLARISAGLIIVACWELTVLLWAPAFIARPSGIVMAIPNVMTDPAFWAATGATLSAVVEGLAISVVAGTVIGIAVGRIIVVERFLQVYVNGFFAMPMVAILPLLTLFFGYTGDARLATVIFAAIFAIIINVADGARAVPREYLEVSSAFRSSAWSRIFDVILPSSIPYLVAGLKLAGGRALIGAIIAEFYAALPGLGYYILFNTRTFKHNEAFVAVALLAFTGVLFELALATGIARFLPWYQRAETNE
jgi:NitT/TauT family transport system permease protein